MGSILPRKKKSPAGTGDPQNLVPAEDRSGKDAKFASEAYNQVARAAKLEGLLLTSSQFDVQPDYFNTRSDDGSGVNFEFGCQPTDEIVDIKNGIASCSWRWEVVGKVKKKTEVSVMATYRVFYSNLINCDEAAVKRFMHRVGRFATYPYFRAHVSQVSWESSANFPLLPTISS